MKPLFPLAILFFAAWVTSSIAGPSPTADSPLLVNDVHSQMNSTRVNRVVAPQSISEIQAIVRKARAEGRSISIAGGRHAMGGQQFGQDTILLDMTRLNRVLNFDRKVGIIEAEAGVQWPELVNYLVESQKGHRPQWGIRQKQTGADRLSLGGALSANVHGRGLKFGPFVQDVESFTLVGPDGKLKTCSRDKNPQLFRLAIGGYGLFGVITTVKLRLAPRQKVERVVKILELKDLMPAFEKRISEGFVFGDFQYATDSNSSDFLNRGVFSCYRPVDEKNPIEEKQKELSEKDWRELYFLAHTDKKKAFDVYSHYYLSTSGQIYWSDTHQMSLYIDNYHEELDRRLGSRETGTEMITEIYVPRSSLLSFLQDVREDFRKNQVDLIYGTIRLIEKDDETFLAWARERYVCIIFNLHVVHTSEGIEQAAGHFRRLIDIAIHYGGSYYLTYHRWASREQVEKSYPRFSEFLQAKKRLDPHEVFQSDWYRHYKTMFAGSP